MQNIQPHRLTITNCVNSTAFIYCVLATTIHIISTAKLILWLALNTPSNYSDSWDSVDEEEGEEGEEEEEQEGNKPTSDSGNARIRNVYVPDTVPSGPVAGEAAPPTRKPQHVVLDIHAAKARAQPEAYEEANLWRQDVKSASVYALNVEGLDTIYDDIHSAVTDMRSLRGGGERQEWEHNYTHLRPDTQEHINKYAIPLPSRRKSRSGKRKYYNVSGKMAKAPPTEAVTLQRLGARP